MPDDEPLKMTESFWTPPLPSPLAGASSCACFRAREIPVSATRYARSEHTDQRESGRATQRVARQIEPRELREARRKRKGLRARDRTAPAPQRPSDRKAPAS